MVSPSMHDLKSINQWKNVQKSIAPLWAVWKEVTLERFSSAQKNSFFTLSCQQDWSRLGDISFWACHSFFTAPIRQIESLIWRSIVVSKFWKLSSSRSIDWQQKYDLRLRVPVARYQPDSRVFIPHSKACTYVQEESCWNACRTTTQVSNRNEKSCKESHPRSAVDEER